MTNQANSLEFMMFYINLIVFGVFVMSELLAVVRRKLQNWIIYDLWEYGWMLQCLGGGDIVTVVSFLLDRNLNNWAI